MVLFLSNIQIGQGVLDFKVFKRYFTKNALECFDLWSEMKSAKESISHVSWGFFYEA